MTIQYKKFKIDYSNSGAVIYSGKKFIKAFASNDKGTSEVSGLEKSKKYIDSL